MHLQPKPRAPSHCPPSIAQVLLTAISFSLSLADPLPTLRHHSLYVRPHAPGVTHFMLVYVSPAVLYPPPLLTVRNTGNRKPQSRPSGLSCSPIARWRMGMWSPGYVAVTLHHIDLPFDDNDPFFRAFYF